MDQSQGAVTSLVLGPLSGPRRRTNWNKRKLGGFEHAARLGSH